MFQPSSTALIPAFWDWQWKQTWRQLCVSIHWIMPIWRILICEVPLCTPTEEDNIPVKPTVRRFLNMALYKAWTVMVAGATIMLDVKACGPEWKASFSMTATIRKAWPRMSWEFLFGDISSVTGTTGGSALPTVGFLLWLSVRDTTNLWAWLHRKWYLWDKCVNQYWQYQLKADNELEWIGKMNNMQACAREIVDKEMIYQ